MDNNTQTKLIKVAIVTPAAHLSETSETDEPEFECDSLRMNALDNEKGNGGGSFGVRYGHADALAALDKGNITAYSNGVIIKTLYIEGGYAKISRDKVVIITPSYKKI